jgi:hypothetical protein
MVTLVVAAREVSYPVRGDQQPAGTSGSIPASFNQTVFAELTIHVALVAIGHALMMA